MDKEVHSHNEEESILDVLLDETNDSPITLYDSEDKPVKFDQVAIIPLEENLYTILKPIEEMEGVEDDEAIVFVVVEDEDGETSLEIETDEAIAMQVFEEYYKLLEEHDTQEE
jgi:hypothetical protein